MSTASPKETVRAGIVGVASSSFLVGLFLMLGIASSQRHEPSWYLMLPLLPIVANILAVAVNARRMLTAVS